MKEREQAHLGAQGHAGEVSLAFQQACCRCLAEWPQQAWPRARPPPPGSPLPHPPAPPLQDILAEGGAVVEVVEADGDAVPHNEGASGLLFVGAETLLEVLVGLEAAA